jgi:ferredoxin
MCSQNRCRQCLKDGGGHKGCELGTGFTHGEYEEWRKKKRKGGSPTGGEDRVPMKRIPVIDLSKCTDCESCLELCPEVFVRNQETGLLEVKELEQYPEDEVQEAMSMCPADCIEWEEIS